jgi:hypothetical protein
MHKHTVIGAFIARLPGPVPDKWRKPETKQGNLRKTGGAYVFSGKTGSIGVY